MKINLINLLLIFFTLGSIAQNITVKGKGGHAAMPEKITNTVLIASQIIIALQQIPHEMAPKGIPTVLSIGKVVANGATNVIPNEVYLEGTFRTMDEDWRKTAHQKIREICITPYLKNFYLLKVLEIFLHPI